MSYKKTKPKTTPAPTEHTSIRPRRAPSTRLIQNFLLVWLDGSIDEVKNEDSANAISKFQEVINSVNTFTDVDECIDFVSDIKEKTFMIVSGALGQTTVPIVHDMTQVSTIYIFRGNKSSREQWVQQWPKVKGVFTDVTLICEAMKRAVHQCDQNSISMSFLATSSDTINKNLDQLDQSFMYTQILKEIILTIDFKQQHIQEFITFCREQCDGNPVKLQNVDKLEQEYDKHDPIWWYTYNYFLYSMVNRALRTMEIDLMINMGFFIRDLEKHITQLHSEQFSGHNHSNTFIVYRGQGLTQTDFDKLVKTKGGLLSFNNFLSTSINRQVSLTYAESNQYNRDLIGILFIMKIDPSISSTPFANVREVSNFQEEEEILFSMHSIFRIGHIQQIDNTHNRVWQVDLVLTNDNDPQLHALTEYIRKGTFSQQNGWFRLANLLVQLGHFDRAHQVCEILLHEKPDGQDDADIYPMLGVIKSNQGEYPHAITYYEKALEIDQKTLPPNHPSFAISYNNIGFAYNSMGEYSKALSYHEKAIEIGQKILPPNHPSLAASYNNIGLAYEKMGEYSKALSYYEKAIEIGQKILPPSHPSMAASYNNIGLAYEKMGQYSKALSYYEKVLEICQKTLPQNHPDLAASYNNIGFVYDSMGEYSKALSYYEKVLEICQKNLPPNHHLLATSYNNIGMVYSEMGAYSKALSCYEKALDIFQKTLPPNHPDFGNSYNNIGIVYSKMGEYSKALSYYEKVLEIFQKTLPRNHPSLATSYSNIGTVYSKMSEYSKALSYYEKAIEIYQKTLPQNHPDLATSYNNIGLVYYKMSEYSKALSYYEKALEIYHKTVSPNHPDLAGSYKNIGGVYDSMGEYSKALSFYEHALEIWIHSLPSNHPDLQHIRESIKIVKEKL